MLAPAEALRQGGHVTAAEVAAARRFCADFEEADQRPAGPPDDGQVAAISRHRETVRALGLRNATILHHVVLMAVHVSEPAAVAASAIALKKLALHYARVDVRRE